MGRGEGDAGKSQKGDGRGGGRSTGALNEKVFFPEGNLANYKGRGMFPNRRVRRGGLSSLKGGEDKRKKSSK